MFYICDNGTL